MPKSYITENEKELFEVSPGRSRSESGLGDGALISGEGIGDTNVGVSSSNLRLRFLTRVPKFR